MYTTLAARVDELAQTQPRHLALAFKRERLAYAELSAASQAMASLLQSMGIREGECVVLCAVSKPATIVAYLALQRLGAVVAFADKGDKPERLVWMYRFTAAKLLLTDKALGAAGEGVATASLNSLVRQAQELAQAHADTSMGTSTQTDQLGAPLEVLVDPTSLSELIFTSGTTSEPKGVMLSRGAVAHIAQATVEGVGYRADDVVLMPLPLNHSFALRVVRAVLSLGATLVLQNGFTFAREVERNLDAFSCTTVAMVPSSVELLSQQMGDHFAEVMQRFRLIEVSAGSLSVGQRLRLTRELAGTQIWNVWGSSETGGVIFANVSALANEPGTPHIASLGVPAPSVEVVLLAPDGTPLDQTDYEHPGRMAFRTPTAMSGYLHQAELTNQTLCEDLLVTGDLAYVEDGQLFFLGRADDLINVGGEKVSPLEVENAASLCELVEDCACLGIDDPKGVLGSVPVLLVVPRGNWDEGACQSFLATQLERHKLPVSYLVVEAIPRNHMRKIDRHAVRALWEGQGKVATNSVVRTLLTRRSVRRFTDEPLARELLEVLVRCGYYAPSGHNMQTWRFTVITSLELIERLRSATAEAAHRAKVNFYGFGNPTALILVSNDERNPMGCQDASAAAENIMLAAWSYGIGSTWLNPLCKLRDVEPVKTVLDELGIPAHHVVWAMIELGYPVAEGALLAKNVDVITWYD